MTYNENLYDFTEYMSAHIRNYLRDYIRCYQASFKESVSMDRHVSRDGDLYSLHSIIRDCSLIPLDELAANQDLFDRLTALEKGILQSTRDGYQDEEIMEQYHLSQRKYKQTLVSVTAKLVNWNEG